MPTPLKAVPATGSPSQSRHGPSPRLERSATRPSRTPVASPAPQASRRAAIADRTPAITGLRHIAQEKLPPSRTPNHPKHARQGPGGFLGSAPALANNDQSFILGQGGPVSAGGTTVTGVHGLERGDFRVDSATPADQNLLTEGAVHGLNPVIKWQVDKLRAEKRMAQIEFESATQLRDAMLTESCDALQRLADDFEYSTEQKQLLAESVRNAKVEFGNAQTLSDFHRQHVEDLRAESRELSLKEAELDLATSALPWVKQLAPDILPCHACRRHQQPVALCRIVRGHCDDLQADGDSLESVKFLHTNFTENKARRGHGETTFVPFSNKAESLSDDVDVNSLLSHRCCRNERGERLEMATSYPWLTTMALATGKDDVNWLKDTMGPKPKADLSLEHVHSYSGSLSKQNILYLHTGAILFNSGTICIVHHLDSNRQKFFRHHTEFVTAFALFPNQANNLVASAQDGANPRVCIWNTETMQLRSMLEGVNSERSSQRPVFPLFLHSGVRSISFSRDGKRLIALSDDAECSIVIHECTSKSTESRWTSSRLFARSAAGVGIGEKALNVIYNPFGLNIVSSGIRHMKFWELHDGGEILCRNGIFGGEDTDETHLCVAFLDAETCVSGTAQGMIWIWKGNRLMQVIAWAHTGPIFDLAVDGTMVLSGGQDMTLCFWNLQKDFRVVPPGKIDRGEMLVKQLQIADTVQRGNSAPRSNWLKQVGVGCVRALAWNSHQVFVGTGFNHIFVVDDLKHVAALIVAGHHRGGMTGVCSHPKLPLVLTAGREGTILVRNLVTTKTLLARNLEMVRASRKGVGGADEINVVKHKTRIIPQKSKTSGQEEIDEEENGSTDDDSDSEQRQKRKKKIPDWPVQLTCIDVCLNGVHVAVGQDDGGFAILTLEYDVSLNAQDLTFKDLFALTVNKPKDPVTCIKISPSVQQLAVGFSAGHVRIYQFQDLWKKSPPFTLCSGFCGSVNYLDWDDKSRCIRANDNRSDLKIFDIRSGSEIDYFGSTYIVRLKRLRFCPPEHKGKEDGEVDFEKHPEAKVIGFGITRRKPYLIRFVSSLVDENGVHYLEDGYKNEQIQVDDKVVEVAGRAVDNSSLETVKHLLHGPPCKPECAVDCAHQIVEIVLARNRSITATNVGPGTGVKRYKQKMVNVETTGPFLMEGKWVSMSCPLTWATHRLYLNDHYIPGEVVSTTRSSHQKMVATGDVYGQVTIHGFPCDPATTMNKEGQKIHFSIEHLAFTQKDTHLLVGNAIHAILTQWKPQPVTQSKPEGELERINLLIPAADGSTNEHLRHVIDRPLASRMFSSEEAKFSHGNDAFDLKLQWWQNTAPDVQQTDETNLGSPCNHELILDHVYGYNGREGRHNVFELENGDLLYPVGCLCVLNRSVKAATGAESAVSQTRQLFFRGHTEFVVALSVHPNGRIVASGDFGPCPLICVWDIESSDWIDGSLSTSLASMRGFHRNGISALSFSGDGEFLLSVGEDASHSIALYQWQTDPLMPLAVYPTGTDRILSCTFNPYSTEFVTCGVKHVSFWEFVPNPGFEVKRKIAASGIGGSSGKQLPDILLQVLLTLQPQEISKLCPSSIICRGCSLSDEFIEWALHDERRCETYAGAKSLGEACMSLTNICAIFVDRETAVTGTIDGRILVWSNWKLISYIDGHDGPIFDLDCPKNRGIFRGDMMISNRKNEKHFVRVELRGASTEKTMNDAASMALKDWFKDFKRTNYVKSNLPEVRHALIRWEASDPQEFMSCGEDSILKLWGMAHVLTVGESTYEVGELFEKFCTRQKGGHKYRQKSMDVNAFLMCLSAMQLLYETEHLYDGHEAYEISKSSEHLRLSRAEAVRIFQDQAVQELLFGDFATCIHRVFDLLGVRAEADRSQFANLRESLEQDLIYFKAQQDNDSTGVYADTYDYSILKTEDDIRKIDAKLKKSRIYMRNTLRCIRSVRFERPDKSHGDASTDVDCFRSVFVKAGMIFVGMSSNSIYAFDMQTGQWSVLVESHESGQISTLSVFPADASILVSGGEDKRLIVRNASTREVEAQGRFSSPVAAVDILPASGQILATGLKHGEILLLHLSRGCLSLVTKLFVKDAITVLRCSPDGRWIAVGYESAKIRLFEVCRDSLKTDSIKLIQHPNEFVGHKGPVTSIDWSEDCKFIQSTSQLAGELLYWTSQDGKAVQALKMSQRQDLAWASFNSVFGWHMHIAHKHVSKSLKLINQDVEPFLGQRVRRVAGEAQTVGTVTRISRDKLCDVRWDTNVHEGTVGIGNSRHQKLLIGYGGAPRFDLTLSESPNQNASLEIVSTDKSHCIHREIPPFFATGDSGGFIELFPFQPPVHLKDSIVVRQQYAHPGGTSLVKFSGDDKFLYSTGVLDHSLCQWRCQPCKDLLFSAVDVLRQCASSGGIREFFGGLALLADNLFPENTVASIRKRDRLKAILNEIREGLNFGPREVVGVTLVLADEGKSVPKNVADEAVKENTIKQDLGMAIGMLPSRIEYCGWERASKNPADSEYKFSHVHLNLYAAEFEGFGKISSAELFADEIVFQAQDLQSNLKRTMITKDVKSAVKKKAFQMLSPPSPPPQALRVQRSIACEYPGCSGAKFETQKRLGTKPDADKKLKNSRIEGFEFRFRRLRSLIFDPIVRTAVTTVNATKPSKAPKPIYRPKKPDLAHQQLITIFEMMDYGNKGWITHADFMMGLRRNPDLAGLLGIPTLDYQKTASRHIYELRYGDEDLDSSGIDDSKKMEMQEFVSFFGKKEEFKKAPECIENSKWTVSDNAMKTPSLCDAKLFVKGLAPAKRRWNQKVTPSSVLPVMTREEAMDIFKELGLSKNDAMTHAEFAWLLRKNPKLEEKLGRKRLKPHELAAFYSDVGMLDPFVETETKKQMVPIGIAFQAFQTIDEEGAGSITIGSFVTGLKRYPAIADSLGLLGRSMRTDALQQIYEYVYGSKNVLASRKIELTDFVQIFSQCDLGQMGLSVPYKPPIRPKMVPMTEPFRVFEQYFSRKEHSVSHAQFLEGLKKYPDAADSLGLQSWMKQSNASLLIFQLLFGVEDYDEQKQITIGDLLRTFSGVEISDLGLGFSYEGDPLPARPDFVSLRTAIDAFHQVGSDNQRYITHGDFIEKMKQAPRLAKKLGFGRQVKDENGSDMIYQIMHGQKIADDSRPVEFEEFVTFFTGTKLDKYGMTLAHKRGVQKADVKKIDLPLAKALWEQLDEHKREFITHGDFWAKLTLLPDVAEALSLVKMSKESDGSLQLYQLMNEGSTKAKESTKYGMAQWIKFFSGEDIQKEVNALGNWTKLTKMVAGLPMCSKRLVCLVWWRKMITRLLLQNAALNNLRGILRTKTATSKASRLALQFLDAIQSPRLSLNDGDAERGDSPKRPVTCIQHAQHARAHTHARPQAHAAHVLLTNPCHNPYLGSAGGDCLRRLCCHVQGSSAQCAVDAMRISRNSRLPSTAESALQLACRPCTA